MTPTMATEPHQPRIDKTTGYWFTKWYAGDGCRLAKTFGHGSKVTKKQVRERFANWLIQRKFQRPEKFTGNRLELLADAYLEFAKTYYRDGEGHPTGECTNIEYALRPLKALFGHIDAGAVKPKHLADYTDAQIEAGIKRSTINKRLGIIKRMYEWAVRGEYVPAELHGALLTVRSLKRGRTNAIEPEPVQPVPLRDLAATIRQLPPVIADMIRLEWLTGMRPGEVCGLSPIQIDRKRKTWLYMPPQHKTAHRGKVRVIALGPKARKLLEPYLFRRLDAPCFTPADSRRWWNQQRRRQAKAPSDPTRLKPVYALADRFTSKTYADAIERAAKKAGVPIWTPNQIRHTAATKEAERSGREYATRLLGHANTKTTAIYITEDMRRLMERAERAG